MAIHKCSNCNKEFPSKSKLERHKERKKPCDSQKECYDCKLCKSNFNHKSLLERHEKTAKHITNINNSTNINHINNINNIHNGDNNTNNTYNINNVQNTIHLTLKTNGFSETNIECLRQSLFESQFYDNHIEDCLKQLRENDIYTRKGIMSHSFRIILEFFKILNFNLAYEKNHNCKIFLFSQSSNDKHIEYHLLEIDNENKQYQLKFVKYDDFIEELIKLMNRVNDKFKNENFKLILNFINTNKKLIMNDDIKNDIETKLMTIYNGFVEDKKRDESKFENERLMQNLIDERKRML